MDNKNKQVHGQMCLDMYLSPKRLVTQSNSLISGKQTLSTNAAKLLRATIMQIDKNDTELKPYVLKSNEIAELLRISKDNIYRVMDNISEELMGKGYVSAREENGKKTKFRKINIVSFCEYDSDYGFAIKLNQDMAPYLLELKGNFTQYQIECMLEMTSEYAIRIYELLEKEICMMLYQLHNGDTENTTIPRKGLNITLSVQYIRECLGLEDMYKRWSQFKIRVIDRAVEEINKVNIYKVTYKTQKTGKTITDIVFHVNTWYH